MSPMVYQYSCAYVDEYDYQYLCFQWSISTQCACVDDEYDYQYLCFQWSISTRVQTLMMSMITSIYVSNGLSVLVCIR